MGHDTEHHWNKCGQDIAQHLIKWDRTFNITEVNATEY